MSAEVKCDRLISRFTYWLSPVSEAKCTETCRDPMRWTEAGLPHHHWSDADACRTANADLWTGRHWSAISTNTSLILKSQMHKEQTLRLKHDTDHKNLRKTTQHICRRLIWWDVYALIFKLNLLDTVQEKKTMFHIYNHIY